MPAISLVILSVLGLSLVALTIPVSITLSFAYSERLSTEVSLSWWLNWVRFGSGGDKSGRGRAWKKLALGIPRKKALGLRLLRLMRSLLRCGRFSRLDLWATIGLDNPADTGRLWGAYCALANVCPLPRNVTLNVKPDFEKTIIEGAGCCIVRIIPLQILTILVLFCLSRPALRTAWALIRPNSSKLKS